MQEVKAREMLGFSLNIDSITVALSKVIAGKSSEGKVMSMRRILFSDFRLRL